MDFDRALGISGVVLGIIGTIGTYFQIFGFILFWIILIVVGIVLIAYFLYSFKGIIKTFSNRWHFVEGQLIIGNTTNVALRTETIQEILDGFREETGERYEIIIRKIGRKIGVNFARDLKKELKQLKIDAIIKIGREPGLIKEKLRLWAKYDSETGIGIFDTAQVDISIEGLKGCISLRNSFLAHDKRSESPSCTFLEGYLEGIMLELIDVDTTIREIECSTMTGSSCCKFKIESKK